MKNVFLKIKTLLFFTCVVVVASSQTAEYHPYRDHTGVSYSYNNSIPFSGVPLASKAYTGEYQIFVESLPENWQNKRFISYRIENVSFPFLNNRSNYQHGIPDPQWNPYDEEDRNWGSLQGIGILWNFYDSESKQENINPNGASLNLPSTLASYLGYCPGDADEAEENYNAPNPINLNSPRLWIPAGVIKHTIYRYCEEFDYNYPRIPVDSISWITDFTRGRMPYYKFFDCQENAGAENHDLTVFPEIILSNSTNATSNSYGTSNYFPIPSTQTVNNNERENCYDFFTNDVISLPSEDYIHPSPYSLVQGNLAAYQGNYFAGYKDDGSGNKLKKLNNTSIKRTFWIDQPIDLKTINSAEKVIYHPSQANISNNVTITFPSGYTFLNARALYPTKQQTENSPCGIKYNDDGQPLPILVPEEDEEPDAPGGGVEGLQRAKYTIKNGSTLIIENCVIPFKL